MVNDRWNQEQLRAFASFGMPGIYSDHAHCTVNVIEEVFAAIKPFKFFNMWTQHENFQCIIEQNWSRSVRGYKMYSFCKKLHALKTPLKELNKLHFAHIAVRAEAAEAELIKLQQQLHDNPDNSSLLEQMLNMRKKSLRLAEADRSYCAQLAKMKYLKNSDRGTNFFHGIIKRNRERNQIVALALENGETTTSHLQVCDAFVGYYQRILGSKEHTTQFDSSIIEDGSMINAQQASDLIKPVTDREIKTALFSIDENKAPGPDGYSSGFYKKAWNVVGDEFCEAIKEFFNSGQILKQINHTVIALVPKINNAIRVGEFRPISCCNVMYKVIAKILNARIIPLLDGLVNQSQSAFVPDRSMAENIYLVQELLRHYVWKRISPRCILKVDLHKAYDTIDWSFIEYLLKAFRFPEVFIRWILQCITTTSFSLSLNGSFHGFFKGKRGLRQGDPLSPSIFVLCMEYLSRSLARLRRNEDFNFHPKCQLLSLNHLAFADDLILFARGDCISVSLLMEKLRDFGNTSGLKINVEKSSFYAAGVCRVIRNELAAITGFRYGTFPFRYLGIPLVASRLTVAQYKPFVNKIADSINSWAGSTLSYAGRAELIRTVLQGVECFWLSLLPVPASVKTKVNCLCRNFLWGGKSHLYKRPLVNWNDVCLPKAEGGLGFRCLTTWNTALLSKNLWNLQSNKESLWVKWIHHYYFKTGSLWDYQVKKQDSPLLKKLMCIRDEICSREGSLQQAQQLLIQWAPLGKLITLKAYDYFRARGLKCTWTKLIWNDYIMPKHGFIFWLAAKNRLKTKDKFRLEDAEAQCVLCKAAAESASHLFFVCSFTKQVWTVIKEWLGITNCLSTIKAAIKWIIKKSRGTRIQTKAKKVAFAATIYTIWETRNLLMYEGKNRTPAAAVRKIQVQVYTMLSHLFPDLHRA